MPVKNVKISVVNFGATILHKSSFLKKIFCLAFTAGIYIYMIYQVVSGSNGSYTRLWIQNTGG
jgi:hypothetical protein